MGPGQDVPDDYFFVNGEVYRDSDSKCILRLLYPIKVVSHLLAS